MIALAKVRQYNADVDALSPNSGSRHGDAIRGIILHATADEGNEAGSVSWMRSPKSQASAHLLVHRDGRVTRLVPDFARAWHAGVSEWRGVKDVNSDTIGIEIANRNDGREKYTDAQYRRVAEIVAHYLRQGLTLDDVTSHAHIAPGRKNDPLGWDWDRFRGDVRALLTSAPPVHRLVSEPEEVEVPSVIPKVAGNSHSGVAPVTTPPHLEPVAIPALGGTMPDHGPAVPVVVTPKPKRHSRTLWVNGVTAVVSLAAIAGDGLDVLQSSGITLPEDVTKYVLAFVGVVNVLLRLRTGAPLQGTPAAKTAEAV